VREYECMMVLHPGVTAADTEAIHNRFEETVKRHGGEITRKDDWGMRELAYEIEKQRNGHYWLFGFTADNTMVSEADRDLRLDDKIMRHLIVRDEKWAERNREAQAQRGLDQKEESDG